ncbi:MAG: hypothetical protein RLZZ46_1280 [Bacteroidota bacterium]|jgi:nicotinate-nucleotide adenylyltransferase
MQGKKIGLFFGSFNPIHSGHLILAQYFINHKFVNEVWLVVSPQNPLKRKESLLPFHHRLALVRIAIEENAAMRASDIELNLPVPSYTSHTLAHLHERYPKHKFLLIMGEDNLIGFKKWKNWETILSDEQLLVYPRKSPIEDTTLFQHSNVIFCKDAPVLEISSSEIRHGIEHGYNMRYYMPDKVFQYLTEMHFYEKKK